MISLLAGIPHVKDDVGLPVPVHPNLAAVDAREFVGKGDEGRMGHVLKMKLGIE